MHIIVELDHVKGGDLISFVSSTASATLDVLCDSLLYCAEFVTSSKFRALRSAQ